MKSRQNCQIKEIQRESEKIQREIAQDMGALMLGALFAASLVATAALVESDKHPNPSADIIQLDDLNYTMK